jgi:uncharacterized protein (DUF433 family)
MNCGEIETEKMRALFERDLDQDALRRLASRVCGKRTIDIGMGYREIIAIEPRKRGGQPCIRRMRVTVYGVLSYLAAGMTPEEILADFPYLTSEDVLARLSYAVDRERHTLVAA